MSSADRDWFREADAGPRGWGCTPACWSLIALHALLWAVPPRLGAATLLDGLALRPGDVVQDGRLYEIASYAFAPGANSPWDLVWALACLLVFGREARGWKRSAGTREPAGPREGAAAGKGATDEAEVERRVDALLGKINREGLASLTDEERQFLKRASRRFRG